jgi:selenocysteine lyase/cysteine desulfurase
LGLSAITSLLEDLFDRLRVRGVASATRDGQLRLSVHVYNHEDDVGRVVGALPPR